MKTEQGDESGGLVEKKKLENDGGDRFDELPDQGGGGTDGTVRSIGQGCSDEMCSGGE